MRGRRFTTSAREHILIDASEETNPLDFERYVHRTDDDIVEFQRLPSEVRLARAYTIDRRVEITVDFTLAKVQHSI